MKAAFIVALSLAGCLRAQRGQSCSPTSPPTTSPTPTSPAITGVDVFVEAARSEWTAAGVSLRPGDVAVLIASYGPIHVGGGVMAHSFEHKVGVVGSGAASWYLPGALKVKLGEHESFFGVASERTLIGWSMENGDVLLRVYDTDYTDNSGVYRVTILLIRREAAGWGDGPWSRRPQR